MTREMDLDQLYERLKDFKTAMLTTVSKDGYLHSRPMMTQERERDSDLWFVSSLNTEKIAEINAHPKVGVIYFRDSDNAYISLSGTARFVTDRDLVRSKWKDSWRAYFPKGPEQEDLVLIKIDVHEAEYWEPQGGRLTIMFEMARSALMGEHPEINSPVNVEKR